MSKLSSPVGAAFVALLAPGLLSTAAWAQYVPSAVPQYFVEGGTDVFAFGHATGNTTGVGGGYGSAASTAAVSAGLSASASGQSIVPSLDTGNYYDAQASAGAQLDYYFAAVGPSANVSVPVTITALVGATAAGVSTVSGDAYVVWYLNGVQQGKVNVGTGCNSGTCSSNDYVDGVPANDEIATSQGLLIKDAPFTTTSVAETSTTLNDGSAIEIRAAGTAYYGSGTFSASADPVIEIDPTWLALNPGYHLVFSPNVTPPTGTGTGTGSVPEPDTLLLGLLGLAGIALSPRRRSAADVAQ
jgi:MYXO-CTERM domain-containing protein